MRIYLNINRDTSFRIQFPSFTEKVIIIKLKLIIYKTFTYFVSGKFRIDKVKIMGEELRRVERQAHRRVAMMIYLK